MRSSAEIDERTASISRRLVRLHLLLDDSLFEGIVGEEVEKLLFRENATLERLLFFENGFDDILDRLEVIT